MEGILSTAHRQWASRPDDERFRSLVDLRKFLQERKDRSTPLASRGNRLDVHPLGDDVVVATDFGTHRLTHYSFGQLAQHASLATPEGGWVSPKTEWLRAAESEMAALVLSYGLNRRDDQIEISLLSQMEPGVPTPVLRSINSASYGRIWDVDWIDALTDAADRSGTAWHVPAEFGPDGNRYEDMSPERQRRQTTLYASDRNTFVFLVDEKHPIEVVLDDGRRETLFRGFFLWNSEVGAGTWGLDFFKYRFVCANRNIYGVRDLHSLRIRHTGNAVRRFRHEGVRMLARYAGASAHGEAEHVLRASRLEVAKRERKPVVEFLRKRGFGPKIANRIYDRADQEGNPSTVWNLVQAGTALARDIPHTDSRLELERQASSLMALAAV